jgi:iron complex transport system substrate-binding protein
VTSGARPARIAALALAIAGCAPTPVAPPARPMRIVSLDYCADQYVLELIEPARIAALSPDARASFSFHRARAAGLRQVRARVEDVLALRPDLVIRSYGGGSAAADLLTRAGVPVLQIGYADDLASVRRNLLAVAQGLGEAGRGDAVARDFDRRLAAIRPADAMRPATLYLTSGGATSGPGTLVDEMLGAAGQTNFERTPGWHAIPLERLAFEQPDRVAVAAFDGPTGWSAARHPVVAATRAARPTTRLDGAWTACGGWFVLSAVERLASAR